MATSYERVLEAARRYSRDPRLQELPRDTSGRQHAQCSCPAHDGDGGTSLHITYDQSNGKTMLHCFGAEHCDAASIAGALGLKNHRPVRSTKRTSRPCRLQRLQQLQLR